MLHSSFQQQIFKTLGQAQPCHHSCDFNKRLSESITNTMCLSNHLHLLAGVHSNLLCLMIKLPLITSCIRLYLNYCSHSTSLMYYSNSSLCINSATQPRLQLKIGSTCPTSECALCYYQHSLRFHMCSDFTFLTFKRTWRTKVIIT